MLLCRHTIYNIVMCERICVRLFFVFLFCYVLAVSPGCVCVRFNLCSQALPRYLTIVCFSKFCFCLALNHHMEWLHKACMFISFHDAMINNFSIVCETHFMLFRCYSFPLDQFYSLGWNVLHLIKKFKNDKSRF